MAKPATLSRSGKGAVVRRSAKGKSTGASPKKSVSALLKEQKPGWKLAPEPKHGTRLVETFAMKTDSAPSLQLLREKFLGDQDAAPVSLGKVDDKVRTVRIQPRKGGASKTADVRNGKITIVQG